jgi:hypothetical protein
MNRIGDAKAEYDPLAMSRVRGDIERALSSIETLSRQLEALRRGQELKAVRRQSMLAPSLGITSFSTGITLSQGDT